MTTTAAFSTSTRRGLLVGAAAIAGAAALPWPARAQPTTRTRFEINAAPQAVVDTYAAGVEKMLQLPPDDPDNWYNLSFMHLLDCPHGNWWFVSWHRAYLVCVENAIRRVTGDTGFALPYWDWTANPRVPARLIGTPLDPASAAFIPDATTFATRFTPVVEKAYASYSPEQLADLATRGIPTADVFMRAATSMYVGSADARRTTPPYPELNRSTQAEVAADKLRDILRQTYFAPANPSDPVGFASGITEQHSGSTVKGLLESGPHDNVHDNVGGYMGAFLSPVDPIFFLHHGNIDRIWDVWTRRQKVNGRDPLPTGALLEAWNKQAFRFFTNEEGAPTTVESGAYAEIAPYGYTYAPGSGEDMVRPEIPVAALSAFSIAADDGRAVVPAEAFASPSPTIVEVTLDVHDVSGQIFHVIAQAQDREPVVIGTIAPFGHLEHGPMISTVVLPDAFALGDPSVAIDFSVVVGSREDEGIVSGTRFFSLSPLAKGIDTTAPEVPARFTVTGLRG